MKKRFLLIAFLLLSLLTLTGCKKSIDKEKALEFKKEYESLNGTVNARGVAHRNVEINEENPFVTTTAEDIVKRIENNETFYVYFGDKLCPWCRSVIEKAIEVANDNNITTVYYVPIWDNEGNEILRDKYILGDDGSLTRTVEGTDSYFKLLEAFDSLLSDYNLTVNSESVATGEKRIYAPNFVYVEKGKAVRLTSAISDKQTDSRGELTEEVLKDEEEAFLTFFLGEVCNDQTGC